MFAATDQHRQRALEDAIANTISADAFAGFIATCRLWTCVGFRCQPVKVGTGRRTWRRLHRSDGRTYVTFGGRNGRFKAYALAILLKKMQLEPAVGVTLHARVWVARLAADFVAVSEAAAAGARGAAPRWRRCAPDLPVLRSLLVCRRVSAACIRPRFGPGSVGRSAKRPSQDAATAGQAVVAASEGLPLQDSNGSTTQDFSC